MRAHITDHDIHAWARAYLTALDHTGRLARTLPRQRVAAYSDRRR
jgi:trehalose 6-phosphate synthase